MSTKTLFIPLALALAFGSIPTMAETTKAKKNSVEGTIKSLKGKTLTITVKADGRLPAVGSACTVLKHFRKNLGFIKTQGWLEIAAAKVKVSGKALKLTVIKKKSKMKVNGKPVNHFKPGVRAKVVWEG
jgi:hypothetical protein